MAGQDDKGRGPGGVGGPGKPGGVGGPGKPGGVGGPGGPGGPGEPGGVGGPGGVGNRPPSPPGRPHPDHTLPGDLPGGGKPNRPEDPDNPDQELPEDPDRLDQDLPPTAEPRYKSGEVPPGSNEPIP